MRMFAAVAVLFTLSNMVAAQPPAGSPPAPTDRTKASHLSAAARRRYFASGRYIDMTSTGLWMSTN